MHIHIIQWIFDIIGDYRSRPIIEWFPVIEIRSAD